MFSQKYLPLYRHHLCWRNSLTDKEFFGWWFSIDCEFLGLNSDFTVLGNKRASLLSIGGLKDLLSKSFEF